MPKQNTDKRKPGRPPTAQPGTLHQLQIRCTEEEWQQLLALLPQDTRERYEEIAKKFEQ